LRSGLANIETHNRPLATVLELCNEAWSHTILSEHPQKPAQPLLPQRITNENHPYPTRKNKPNSKPNSRTNRGGAEIPMHIGTQSTRTGKEPKILERSGNPDPSGLERSGSPDLSGEAKPRSEQGPGARRGFIGAGPPAVVRPQHHSHPERIARDYGFFSRYSYIP